MNRRTRQLNRQGMGLLISEDDFYFDDLGTFWDMSWFGGGGGGGNWWNNFNEEGDYDPGSFFGTIATSEPGGLPSVPTDSNWWDSFITPWPYEPSGWTPTFDDVGVPVAPPEKEYPPCDGIWQGVMKDGVPTIECVPRPGATAQQKTAARRATQQAQQQQQRQQQQQQPKCPTGTRLNSRTRRCECPTGMRMNPQTRRCERVAGQANQNVAGKASGIPWWVWLLLAGGVVAATSGDDGKRRRR